MAAGSRFDDTLGLTPVLAEAALADERQALPRAEIEIAALTDGRDRRLAVYDPMAVFGLVEELAHLSRRAIDKNVFFDPRFLAPAMPRLDDRSVKLMVIRDQTKKRSRLRLLMPFSVERTSMFRSSATIRAWTHPFGPNGTLLVDGDDPDETLSSFLKALLRPELQLPQVLVLPDLRLDDPMARRLLAVAKAAGLPSAIVNETDRAALVKEPGVSFPQLSVSRRRLRELARQRRRLALEGTVGIEMARTPEAVRPALEDFLAIEASGWKGRTRSALVMDRYRCAFAREAVNSLAEDGRVRIFTLKAGSTAVASLVVFVDQGEAYAWKTAYDERFSAASPGQQVVAEATRRLLADPAVKRMDSCTVPDHFVMNRFWPDRLRIGTIVVGLVPDLERQVDKTAKALSARSRSRNRIRIARGWITGR